MEWQKEFETPTMRNRIKPFWFWNGDLSEEEIDRQLQEMKKQGLGGAFICARQGQKIPYLSKKMGRTGGICVQTRQGIWTGSMAV